MENNKLLSILIPVYNTEKYLPKCLDSLVASKYLDSLDIIVVSDGSPDNSLKIAQNYQERYPSVFNVIDKPNGGHGSTINRGIKEAKGKYFRVLDSDDWFDTTEFDRYLDQLSKLDVDMVLTDYTKQFVYNGQTELYTNSYLSVGKLYNPDELDYSKIPGDRFITMAKATFALSVLKASGLSLYEHCFYVDVQFALFVYQYVKSFVYLDCNVYMYFIGRPEQSMSIEGYKRHYKDHTMVMLSCGKYIKEHSFTQSKQDKWLYEALCDKIVGNFMQVSRLPNDIAKEEARTYDDKLKEYDIVGIVKKNKYYNLYKFSPLLFFSFCRSYLKIMNLLGRS